MDRIKLRGVRKKTSEFSISKHRTNPGVHRGGQKKKKCGVCTQWNCSHREEPGNVICGMGGTRDCHRKQIQLGLGRQCLYIYDTK